MACGDIFRPTGMQDGLDALEKSDIFLKHSVLMMIATMIEKELSFFFFFFGKIPQSVNTIKRWGLNWEQSYFDQLL